MVKIWFGGFQKFEGFWRFEGFGRFPNIYDIYMVKNGLGGGC